MTSKQSRDCRYIEKKGEEHSGDYTSGRAAVPGGDCYCLAFLSSQYSRLSARASQLASMMLVELPTVLHWS